MNVAVSVRRGGDGTRAVRPISQKRLDPRRTYRIGALPVWPYS